jgi:hypothetical protein
MKILSNLDFLRDVHLVLPGSAVTEITTDLPESVFCRLYKKGQLIVSEKDIEFYLLEYVPKKEDINLITKKVKYVAQGVAADVFKSSQWTMINKELPEEILFISFSARERGGNFDLFDQCYYEDGVRPSYRINDRTITSASLALRDLLTEVYAVNWEETDYVDLCLLTEFQMTTSSGTYYIPKTGKRGAKKGKPTYEKRSHCLIFPLVPVNAISSVVPVKEIGVKPEPVIEIVTREEVTLSTVMEVEDSANPFEIKVGQLSKPDWVDDSPKEEEAEVAEPETQKEEFKDPGEDWTEHVFDHKAKKDKPTTQIDDAPPSEFQDILNKLLGKE